ncbi:acetolactate synthase [Podospora conica]|nr:acetolactate synthase [Schizothecium conicum]
MATETVQIVIDSLLAAGVKYIFGVPGAKIDSLFIALLDHPEIKVVVCRHEQNAAFIAAAVGRLTGRPGVCVATSGPGTSNLVTGLVTATDEGAPMVAIVGSVKRRQAANRTHQSLHATELLAPVTKKVVAAVDPDQIAEIMVDAFRVANSHPRGATAIILPVDIMTAGVKSTIPAFPSTGFTPPDYGPSLDSYLQDAATLIAAAKCPVLFLGSRAADAPVVDAVHAFLRQHPIPVVETFQAAGAISRELVHLFFGRVGLFRNQPGDKLLQASDLVITLGYDQAEYDASLWNTSPRTTPILHIDTSPADLGHAYSPRLELIGSLTATLTALTSLLTSTPVARPQDTPAIQSLLASFNSWRTSVPDPTPGPVHPLHFIRLLQALLPDPDTVVTCDVGSVYIYFSRYFYSYAPRTFLVSNAQQTLGVALPWAIGASLSQAPVPCAHKVVSVSGDGGFLFSGQELATAVQQGCNITHFVWNDGHYNMVEFQEVAKYGRSAGVELGGVDFKAYAEAFGAKGMRVTEGGQMEEVMREALAWEGVCVVDVAIDYSGNGELMREVHEDGSL